MAEAKIAKKEVAVNPDEINYPDSVVDKDIHCLLKSKYTLLYIVSYEENRVLESLLKFVDNEENNYQGLNVWDSTNGLQAINGSKPEDKIPVHGGEALQNPQQVFDFILKKAKETKHKKGGDPKGPIFVMLDLFKYMAEGVITPEFERQLRVLHTELKSTQMHIVIVSPILNLPISLEKSIAVVDYPLPCHEDHKVLVKHAKDRLVSRNRMTKVDADAIPDEQIIQALLGLTRSEAEDALAKAFILKKKFDIPTILDIKKQIIRKGQLLDYMPALSTMNEVGGFQGLKEFINLRKTSFSEDARNYGLPQPKGVFMLGLPGCGKTLAAKSIASFLQVPLLKLDMGKLFGSYIGESETNMKRAIKLAESVSPCVLFIDEVDKSLAGSQGSTTDSGTTKRVIASLLDWLMEKTAPVFVVCAANSLNELQSAFLRKGRFDELFFVDLPNDSERSEIFKIHIEKRNRKVENFNVKELVGLTEGFSGAEIEGIIVDAMYRAYARERSEPTNDDLKLAIKMCNPLSIAMKPDLDKLREDCNEKKIRPVNQSIDDYVQAAEKGERFDL